MLTFVPQIFPPALDRPRGSTTGGSCGKTGVVGPLAGNGDVCDSSRKLSGGGRREARQAARRNREG